MKNSLVLYILLEIFLEVLNISENVHVGNHVVHFCPAFNLVNTSLITNVSTYNDGFYYFKINSQYHTLCNKVRGLGNNVSHPSTEHSVFVGQAL